MKCIEYICINEFANSLYNSFIEVCIFPAGHYHTVKLLLEAGARPDLDPVNEKGLAIWAALMTNHCRLDILSLLLVAGCSLSLHENKSPIQFAVQRGWYEAAYMMIMRAEIDPVKEWQCIQPMVNSHLNTEEANILFEEIRKMANSPITLMSQSRRVVRKRLPNLWPYWERVKPLHLPTYLKEYLICKV